MTGAKVSPMYARPVPEFQALPSSITAVKLVQPTKVEFFPKDDDLPQVDLKGHTVEELAAAANVSIEVIQSAIKVRQQQMLAEKKGPSKWSWPTKTMGQTAPVTTPSELSEKVTTRPSTTPFMSKKKVTKKVIRNGHKVSRRHAAIASEIF